MKKAPDLIVKNPRPVVYLRQFLNYFKNACLCNAIPIVSTKARLIQASHLLIGWYPNYLGPTAKNLPILPKTPDFLASLSLMSGVIGRRA